MTMMTKKTPKYFLAKIVAKIINIDRACIHTKKNVVWKKKKIVKIWLVFL